MKKVTHHAKIRIKERGNNNINTSNKALARYARKNGIKLETYQHIKKTSPLISYLFFKKKIHPKCTFFLYLNYIFVFENKILITLYPIPKKFENEKEELKKIKKNNSKKANDKQTDLQQGK